MIQDMHLHSNYSDGQNTLEEVIICAISLGINKICFTDHVWKTSEWVEDYLEEIEYLRIKYQDNIDIVAGVEAKLLNLDGEIDIDNSLYNKKVRVVAAIHRIPLGEGKFLKSSEINQDLSYSRKSWLKAFKSFKNNPKIDCIAHPFYLLDQMKINKNDEDWWKEISDALEQIPTYIEYNVKYNNSIVPEWLWDKFSNRVFPASDSHSTFELQDRFDELFVANQRFNQAV